MTLGKWLSLVDLESRNTIHLCSAATADDDEEWFGAISDIPWIFINESIATKEQNQGYYPIYFNGNNIFIYLNI